MTPATLIRQPNSIRSTFLLLLLCVTIVWPASLQSLFQSLNPADFLACHTVSEAHDGTFYVAQNDSLAVAEYIWTPDPSDNQSALTKASQSVAFNAVRLSDLRRLGHTNVPDGNRSDEITGAEAILSTHGESNASAFFAACILPSHANAVPDTSRFQALALEPWLSPARLPSDRGLVRFALAPPTFC